MALDFKNVARNQVASRTSRGLKAGLTKVAGNILGSALGSASPANLPKTNKSEREFPPKRFAPCSPAAHSPHANNPGTFVSCVS